MLIYNFFWEADPLNYWSDFDGIITRLSQTQFEWLVNRFSWMWRSWVRGFRWTQFFFKLSCWKKIRSQQVHSESKFWDEVAGKRSDQRGSEARRNGRTSQKPPKWITLSDTRLLISAFTFSQKMRWSNWAHIKQCVWLRYRFRASSK